MLDDMEAGGVSSYFLFFHRDEILLKIPGMKCDCGKKEWTMFTEEDGLSFKCGKCFTGYNVVDEGSPLPIGPPEIHWSWKNEKNRPD